MVGPFAPATTLVLRNPISGRKFRSQRRADRLERELEARGYAVRHTERAGHAGELVAAAVGEGAAAVIVIGGDGTLLETLPRLGPETAIGVFPTGTINLFARGMGVTDAVDPWLGMLAAGTTRSAYLATMNGRPFSCVASVGLDAETIRVMNPTLKRWAQEWAFVWTATKEYFKYRSPAWRVAIDGEPVVEPVQGITIAKGPYFGGPHRLFPDADHAAPELDLALLTGRHKRVLWLYTGGLVTGRLPKMAGAVYRKAKRLTIESDPPSPIELDGEYVGTTPAEFTVDPTPRTVLAPTVEGT